MNCKGLAVSQVKKLAMVGLDTQHHKKACNSKGQNKDGQDRPGKLTSGRGPQKSHKTRTQRVAKLVW